MRVPITAAFKQIEWEPDSNAASLLLDHVRRTWTKLGETSPHWSVLSAERFLPGAIAQNQKEFYDSGNRDVATIEATLHRCGYSLNKFKRCYEYGCGLGRVTLPLSERVEFLTASDISPTHMAVARERVKEKGSKNVYLIQIKDSESFGMTDIFDFWYSRIVLQHNPPPIIAMILRRALATLAPGGVAVFQVPTYALNYEFDANAYLKTLKDDKKIEMHCIPQHAVFRIARENNCIPIEVREDHSVGHPEVWVSNQFVFEKK